MHESNNPVKSGDSSTDELFGEVIFSYSRQQAIEDGVLVDVTEMAKEAGFKWPFAMTAEVWTLIENIPEKYQHEDVQGRLWDVLMVALMNVRAKKGQSQDLFFDLILHQRDTSHLRLKLMAGPGDSGEPVLTLMLPDQD